jgi:hypothetical protein
MTKTNTTLQIGTTVRIDDPSGDSYIGEVIETHSPRGERAGYAVLGNYSAWYDGDATPYNSDIDDTVRVALTNKTQVFSF